MTAGPARLRALIVDDEALARRRLAAMLEGEPDLEVVGEADGGSAAVQAIVAQRPDIVFLDVQMPALDGFGVLRCTAAAHRPVVVFVTAHDAYAIRAFEVHAADYLLKPVVAARLKEAVRRAVARARAGGQEKAVAHVLAEVPPTPAAAARIPVRKERETVLLAVGDISRVEADGDHVVLHVAGRAVTTRATMAEVEAQLDPFGFVRVHRSTIVNPAWVVAIESVPGGGYRIVLRDGTRVRSGRSHGAAVRRIAAGGAPAG
ncbi:MAG TPA: LytTR family DNA-binding domain-containing protein [Gemmatimonadaceae bacterium]|nr:LytTR family DNA-binding domain-containing protein [Gemmatimonadaceae bacterium]